MTVQPGCRWQGCPLPSLGGGAPQPPTSLRGLLTSDSGLIQPHSETLTYPDSRRCALHPRVIPQANSVPAPGHSLPVLFLSQPWWRSTRPARPLCPSPTVTLALHVLPQRFCVQMCVRVSRPHTAGTQVGKEGSKLVRRGTGIPVSLQPLYCPSAPGCHPLPTHIILKILDGGQAPQTLRPTSPAHGPDRLEDVLFMTLKTSLRKPTIHKNISKAHVPTYAEPCSLTNSPGAKPREPAPQPLLQRAADQAHRGRDLWGQLMLPKLP